jgi:hypothetical protein
MMRPTGPHRFKAVADAKDISCPDFKIVDISLELDPKNFAMRTPAGFKKDMQFAMELAALDDGLYDVGGEVCKPQETAASSSGSGWPSRTLASLSQICAMRSKASLSSDCSISLACS